MYDKLNNKLDARVDSGQCRGYGLWGWAEASVNPNLDQTESQNKHTRPLQTKNSSSTTRVQQQ